MNFSDTKIAFSHRTDKEIARARILFTMIQFPFIVKTGKALVRTALAIRFPIGWILKPTLYRQFVGGENLSECLPIVDRLSKQGIYSILDYSVEGANSEKEFDSVTAEIARTIETAAQNPHIAFAVFKPTALIFPSILKNRGFDKKQLTDEEQKAFDNFSKRIDYLCSLANEKSVRLLIDAEDVWYQDSIDEVVEAMMEKYNSQKAIVWNTWQMYRTDRLEHLQKTIQWARSKNIKVGVKLVRGAYMEKERKRALEGGYPSPILPDKQSTDKSYNDALRVTLENIDICELFNGTHNEESCYYLAQLMKQMQLSPNDSRIWTSQLYGMSDHISYNMANSGYNVVKYIPYGPVRSVAPYLLRRAEENSAIRGQTTRELNLILEETKRRNVKL